MCSSVHTVVIASEESSEELSFELSSEVFSESSSESSHDAIRVCDDAYLQLQGISAEQEPVSFDPYIRSHKEVTETTCQSSAETGKSARKEKLYVPYLQAANPIAYCFVFRKRHIVRL